MTDSDGDTQEGKALPAGIQHLPETRGRRFHFSTGRIFNDSECRPGDLAGVRQAEGQTKASCQSPHHIWVKTRRMEAGKGGMARLQGRQRQRAGGVQRR